MPLFMCRGLYGLIAEEVAAIYPQLAVYGRDGQVESLQYHQRPALLLNEMQKQHQEMQKEHQTIQRLEERIAELKTLLGNKVQATTEAVSIEPLAVSRWRGVREVPSYGFSMLRERSR